MIRYAVIGTGWRSAFFTRVARLAPDAFQVTAVLSRSAEKGEAFARAEGVRAVYSLDALLDTRPDFVVVCVARGFAAPWLRQLAALNIPVLAETPPGETGEELNTLWQDLKDARIQVAEQYFLQPLYAAWQTFVETGLLGRVQTVSLSALHGYHGVSIIRRMLGVGYENCRLFGKRHTFDVTETGSRQGMLFDGRVASCDRDRLTLEFESGATAFFDFSSVQYRSFIRTRHLSVQGTRGEIDDLTVRYLDKSNLPVTQSLNRIDQGVYNNQEWAHFAMMLGDRLLYRTPLPGARLNDDELAVAGCLLGMARYLDTGEPFYPLREALQDTYISLKMDQALTAPLTIVETETQRWAL